MSINLEYLMKLRVVVARVGEMKVANWWNTHGQLSPLGAVALRRGFPRTHYFAQARSVFAVADARCRELFDPPKSVTLWHLPPAIEEEFDTRWEHWLDNAADWNGLFERVAAIQEPELTKTLKAFELVTDSQVDAVSRVRVSQSARAIQLPGTFDSTDDTIARLALGFARGSVGNPMIPYMLESEA